MLNNNVVVKVCAQTVNGEPVSPWKIFLLAKLRWHLLTLNFFPADLARHLLTCKFFHLQIWHGAFQGCRMHRKTKMIKPKFKSKLKSSKQPWNPLRPKPKYHIPSKTSKFCWKTTKWCENHQKQIRNALQPNCTTINAIIVTNTTKYGSVHRSGTLHHKPSCKNTERSQKTTKGHKRPPRIQMPPRDD